MNKRTLILLVVATLASQAYADPESALRVRAFARLPNWTGLWEGDHSVPTPLNGAFAPSGTSICPFTEAAFTHSRLLAKPPYNPVWERKYLRAMSAMKDHGGLAAAIAALKYCGVTGFPAAMESLAVFQVVVTPEETLLLYPDGGVRHVYTDGRAHPPKEDLWPTPMGDSIGHWDGATLVIDTIERTPGPVSPIAPYPGTVADLSEQAHFTERLRKVGKDSLQDDLTIEDPLRFTHPWHVSLHYARVTNQDRMIAYNCENDRNPTVNGKITVAAP
ncbi:MAG TPA: hypothetical protein VGV09_04000 [Steroidobacteraceae bacterium]|nr:hypothetical protein [Steroidobacteraceae bacterium]